MSKMTKSNLISLSMVNDAIVGYACNMFAGARNLGIDSRTFELAMNFTKYETLVKSHGSKFFTKKAYEAMLAVKASD